jgi:hypothetical protein
LLLLASLLLLLGCAAGKFLAANNPAAGGCA